MAKKVWKMWTLLIAKGKIRVHRYHDGTLGIGIYELTPTEARRLFQKLSGDYRD